MLDSDSPAIQDFLKAWHEFGRASYESQYKNLDYDVTCKKTAKTRKRYIALDRDTSGVFLVDRLTHRVYDIKAYGVPNYYIGTLESLTASYASSQGYWLGSNKRYEKWTPKAQERLDQEAVGVFDAPKGGNTMTHTPGPWNIDTIVEYAGELRNGHYGIFTREREVARVHVNDPSSTNARDDARLIAAAPALLEALEAALYTMEQRLDISGGDHNPHQRTNQLAIRSARNAIKQARGEE